jgi:integrase
MIANTATQNHRNAVRSLAQPQRPLIQNESADFAEFLGLAGVGQAEAVGLKWEDIDLKAGRINYVRKKTKTAFHTPVFAWLKPLLTKLRKEGATSGPVFKIKNVKKALAAACRRLGLPHFTQRGLRAMRIKRLWEAGVDVKIIAQWQGHRDGGKLIMTIYTEVFGSSSDSYERAEQAKAERLFASKEKKLVAIQKAA